MPVKVDGATRATDHGRIGRVRDYLRGEIDRSAIRIGDSLPSRSALARKFKLSPSAVSIALGQLAKDVPLEAVPGKGVYLRERLPAERMLTVAMIGYGSDALTNRAAIQRDTYWRGIYHSLICEAQTHDTALTWVPNSTRRQLDFERVLAHRPDCIISFGIPLQAGVVQDFRRRRMPIVSGNRQLEDQGLSYADYDTVGGFRQMVELFLERGHRRIGALVLNPSIGGAGEKNWSAFCTALASRRCIYDYAQYWRVFNRGEVAAGRDLQISQDETIEAERRFAHCETLALLDLPEPPTALYCWNEFLAHGAAEAIAQRGLKPGVDVGILITGCVEDDEPYSLLAEPHDELAAQLLRVARRCHEDPQSVIQVNIPKRFVDRGTMGGGGSRGLRTEN